MPILLSEIVNSTTLQTDIMEFIYSKENNSELNNFNISVGVSDKFMEAVAKEEDYDLIDPRDESKVGRLNAAEVYQTLVKQAWKNGENYCLDIA